VAENDALLGHLALGYTPVLNITFLEEICVLYCIKKNRMGD